MQVVPVPWNTVYISQHHYHYHYGYEHGGVGSHCIIPGSGTALYSDLWTREKHQLYISVLELRAVHLTLLQLEQEVLGQRILIESNNMATVSYINKQEGVVS